MPATKCVHHLVYDPPDEQGNSRCHCLKCPYSKVVPTTFDAVMKSLNKSKVIKQGTTTTYVNVYSTEVLERNQRQIEERYALQQRR